MITYVNTVLVGKGKGLFSGDINTLKYDTRAAFNAAIAAEAGKIVVDETNDSKFRVGIITNKAIESYVGGNHTFRPQIRWSNDIKKADIKSFNVTNYNTAAAKEDVITVDFTNSTMLEVGNRVILKLTFKDLPTRFRRWTESYEFVIPAFTAEGEEVTSTNIPSVVAAGLKDRINKNYKRARIDATVSGAVLTLTALEYDDDEVVDSISPFNKVRFNANVWYTDPAAAGFASKNKYATGAVIEKTPGVAQIGEWKVVRDAEAQAMGYMGILNRGEGTWPIIKPDMNVEMGATYDSLTLEFENMYRTADDLHRRTKQTLQIFDKDSQLAAIAAKIVDVAGIEDTTPEINTTADQQEAQGE